MTRHVPTGGSEPPGPSPNRCATDPSHTDHHLFTCTFCWHLSSGPPRVLGRSARLACRPCTAALLDLAVCWACGEVVFRGDDCVSLGWCFWHRACYACLLCGSGAVCRGVTAAELFSRDEEAVRREVDRTGERQLEEDEILGRGRGREIDEVPLCANCVVETEIDELDGGMVVQKGLRRVDRIDGGLTRRRWEVRQGELARRKLRSREPSSQSHGKQSTGPFLGDGANSDLGLGETGHNDCQVPLDSTIYVSIFDPFGESTFKPNPVKPIPRWMQLPPAHKTDVSSDDHQQSMFDDHFGSFSPVSSCGTSTICPCTSRPQSPPPRLLSPSRTPRELRRPQSPTQAHLPSPGIAKTTGPQILDMGPHQTISFVSTEPLKRPSSRLAHHIRTETAGSSSPYMTPPEYPSPPGSLRTPPYHPAGGPAEGSRIDTRFPYVSANAHVLPARVTSIKRVSTPSLAAADPQREQTPHRTAMLAEYVPPRRSSPRLSTQIASHLQRISRGSHSHAQLPMSSEYLDRYKPVKGPSTVGTSSHRPQQISTIAHGEGLAPIVEKIRRNSRAGPSTGIISGETALADGRRDRRKDRVSAEREGERERVVEDDNGSKRLSLQAELRRLFGGR